MTTKPWRAATRVYAALLRLGPTAFRRAYAPAMLETFSQRLAEGRLRRGRVGAGWVFVREVAGLLLAVARLRTVGGRGGGKGWKPSRRWTVGSSMVVETRHAIRRLAKSPGFTLATVATLALGIGANAAIFSVVHGVVLRPLHYPEPDRIVWLDHGARTIHVDDGLGMTRGLFLHYRARSTTLEEVAIYQNREVTLAGEAEPERVLGAEATFTLTSVLEVPPMLGRWFRDEESRNGSGVVVLGHGLWDRRYGADPHVLGRTIQVDGVALEVVGVMPEHFAFPQPETQIWIPLVVRASSGFGGFSQHGIARLEPGVTPADAMADLDRVLTVIPEVTGERLARRVIVDAGLAALVTPLRDHLVGRVAQTLWILLGTVVFVLLIACANVANLFLVRAEGRRREIALRTALGASRGDLIRHCLIESAILTVGGGVVGVILGLSAVKALVSVGPEYLPRLPDIRFDANVLAFAGLIVVLVTVLLVALPALSNSPRTMPSLQGGRRGTTPSRSSLRSRHVLVVSQIALALILLVGSGLMARSYWHLRSVDPGFSARNVLTFEIGLPTAGYATRAQAASFFESLLDRLAGLPGVQSVGTVSCLPLSGWCSGDPLLVQGRELGTEEIPPVVAFRSVTTEYFETVGIPVLAGRLIDRASRYRGADEVVVSQTLADIYFPNEDPVGKRVHDGGGGVGDDPNWYTIVGVVGNVQARGLTDDGTAMIYFPLLSTDNRGPTIHRMRVVVRTAIPPFRVVDAVRSIVRSLDPDLPLAHVQRLDKLVSDAGARMAFTMWLLAIAAFVALTLGAVGVYGVVSYVVAQRRGEIGLRVALGARGIDVSRLVLRQGAIMTAIGVTVGLAGAISLTRVLDALLFGVAPTDLATYAAVTAALVIVALVATYVPARRAGRVDPMEALRAE